VHRIDALTASLPQSFGSSTHHFGLADTLELARSLGKLPGRLVVYGIEGGSFAAGPGLGQPVDAAADALADEIVRELRGGAHA
jgi:hydrogenase maturation protease